MKREIRILVGFVVAPVIDVVPVALAVVVDVCL